MNAHVSFTLLRSRFCVRVRVPVAAAAAVLVAGAGLLRAEPPPQAPAAKAPAGRVDRGAALYKKVGCLQCHVNEGQGGAAGPRIAPDPVPFARFVQYIRKPAGDMPPYTEKVMSEQDLADIYAFLQARRRPPALKEIPLLAQ
jgi:mono/diheme cytochrome c family protein